MKNNKITAIGELLIDFTPTGMNGGHPSFTALPGGAPANFLAAAAAFGADASMIAKVGADSFGAMLKKSLTDAGVNASGVVEDESVFTTLAFVTLDESGDRSFSFARKPGADIMLTCEDVDMSLIESAELIHFGSLSFTDEPSAGTVEKVIRRAKEAGKLISYDPNYRAPLWRSERKAVDKMRLGLSLADIVKISGEELQLITGYGAEEGADELLERYGCSLVFVTLGRDGCYYRNKNGGGYVENYDAVRTVDTTGTGDIFGGSAAAAVLETKKHPSALTKEELARICRYACTAASLSTEKHGGISSVPDKRTVLGIIHDQ